MAMKTNIDLTNERMKFNKLDQRCLDNLKKSRRPIGFDDPEFGNYISFQATIAVRLKNFCFFFSF